jgi:DNA-binding NarL/FixJ family response regulator
MEQRNWRPATDDELVLSAVVITGDETFYSRLRRIADDCRWRLVRAESIEEAEMLIGRKPTPLVVYEGDAGNGNWRFALRRLTDLPPHPCVLLASAVADENLLREVMRNSGYDILPKAASSERLVRALNFAWFWALSWERGRR